MTGSRAVLTAVHHAREVEVVTRLAPSTLVHVVRRCVDLAELVSTAEAGLADRALVSADLRGLDRAVVLRLDDAGVGLVGLHEPDDAEAARDLRRWGVPVILPVSASLADLESGLLGERHDPPSLGRGDRRAGDDDVDRPAEPAVPSAVSAGPAVADEVGRGAVRHGASGLDHGVALVAGSSVRAPGAAEPDEPEPPTDHAEPAEPGRVVVVWGPTGAPGRTTVAVNLAAESADSGRETLLVDADTYGASIAQAMGLLDEAPGLVAAARAADQGALDARRLAALALRVTPRLRVLTGLPRPERWPEVREHALADVLAVARELVPLTVLDIGFCLEQDEELFFDTRAPRRHGLALRALQEADVVVAVGGADPLGVQRLVRGLDALREATPLTPVVVLNRVRSGAVGGDARARLTDALRRFAAVTDPVLVPDDRPAFDAAGLAGVALVEAHPRSPARVALRSLARQVGGATPAPGRPSRTRARGRLGRRRPR